MLFIYAKLDCKKKDSPITSSVFAKLARLLKRPTLLLEASNFRALRCSKAATLLEPASEDERTCWGDNLLPKELHGIDLEDVYAHYAHLGASKSTSDADLAASYQRLHKNFLELARTHHPDKLSPDDPERVAKTRLYMQASAEDLLAQAAFRELCTPDDHPDDDFEHTYGRRVNYDKLGEAHRDSFLAAFAKAHPDKTVAQRAAEIDAERARAAIFAKGAATKEANKELSPLDTVVHKWVRKGQQDNYSRKAICDAFDAGYSQAAMVHQVDAQAHPQEEEGGQAQARRPLPQRAQVEVVRAWDSRTQGPQSDEGGESKIVMFLMYNMLLNHHLFYNSTHAAREQAVRLGLRAAGQEEGRHPGHHLPPSPPDGPHPLRRERCTQHLRQAEGVVLPRLQQAMQDLQASCVVDRPEAPGRLEGEGHLHRQPRRRCSNAGAARGRVVRSGRRR